MRVKVRDRDRVRVRVRLRVRVRVRVRFCALVQADRRFTCEPVRTFEDGQSNRREVLQVRWRDAPLPNVDQPMAGA